MCALDLSGYHVLVSGAAGFLGYRLVQRLLHYRATVTGFDIRPMSINLDVAGNCGNRWSFHRGDLDKAESQAALVATIGNKSPMHRVLFHLAGLSHVGRCQDDPPTAYRTNVLQTVTLLEACREVGITRILFPSTALVYGNHREDDLTEDDAVYPQTVYASTKLAAEAVLQGYAGSFNFSCEIARFSNIYGPDANPDTAVSIALRQAVDNHPIKLRTLTPVRDFIYCEDAIEALIRLMVTGDDSGCRITNVSTGRAATIKQMVIALACVSGAETVDNSSQEPQHNPSRLVLTNKRFIERTGWQPEFTLEKGLQAAWEKLKRE